MSVRPIYLDYAATTPVKSEVLSEMQPYFQSEFGNSASGLHAFGWDANKVLKKCRDIVSQTLGCQSVNEVTFTSGATESNNWAIRGTVERLIANGEKEIHIITSEAEHNSICKIVDHLPSIFQQVTFDFLPTNQYGQISFEILQAKIKPTTKLISIMWVNNELGSINPIIEIGNLARRKGILFHTDATQAVGKTEIDFKNLPIDMLSFSGHKIYGPKGVGVLLVRNNQCLLPLFHGGGQEYGLRSGTVNIPGVVGLSKALELILITRKAEWDRITNLRNYFLELLSSLDVVYYINSAPLNQTSDSLAKDQMQNNRPESIPHILNITFPHLKKYSTFEHFAYSQGSACHSATGTISHVLKAIKMTNDLAEKTFRFSFGCETTLDDIKKLSEIIKQHQIKTQAVDNLSTSNEMI